MSLIYKIYNKLNSLNKPVSYAELALMSRTEGSQTRNAVRHMINRRFPIEKTRVGRIIYVSLSSSRDCEYYDNCHKLLAKNIKAFIKEEGRTCDESIAERFNISISHSYDTVSYLTRTNGIKVIKKNIKGVTYYSLEGMVYKGKPRGNFDNHSIDHLLFTGQADRAVKLNKLMLSGAL